MKIPVMIQLFRDRDAGLLSLDDSIPITNTFRSIVDSSRTSSTSRTTPIRRSTSDSASALRFAS